MLVNPDLLVTYFVSIFSLACTPGVSLAALAQRTLTQGTDAGVNLALGILLARLSKIAVVVIGLAQLVELVEFAGGWLRLAGAAYLAFIGYRVLVRRPSAMPGSVAPSSALAQMVNGFVISWSNPNALLFLAIVLPQFVDPSADVWQQLLVLGALWALVALAVELALVLCLTRIRHHAPARGSRYVRCTFGSVLLVVAIWLFCKV